MKFYLLLLFFPCFSIKTFTQQCNAILIPDQSQKYTDKQRASIVLNILNEQGIQTYKDWQESKYSATVPIEGIPVGGSAEEKERKFQEFRHSLYKYEFNSNESREVIKEFTKLLSKEAIDAWSKCIAQYGFHIWLEQGTDPNTFILVGEYKDDGSGNYPTLKDVSFSEKVITKNGCFTTKDLETNTNLKWTGARLRQIFKRANTKPLTITVSAIGPGYYTTLNEIAPPPKAPQWLSLTARVLNNEKHDVGFQHSVAIVDVSTELNKEGAEVRFYNRTTGKEVWAGRLAVQKEHWTLVTVEGQRYNVAVRDVTTSGGPAAELRVQHAPH